ncbi:MAG: exopolyphosphatase [Flavobacteriales bacterium]
MRLAAIDIGSNAIRLLIEEVITDGDEHYIRKISLTRVPLRLGADSFTMGKISTKKTNQLVRTMEAFWNLMDVHDVIDFRACATSAMREASNGLEVIDIVRMRSNINIEIIKGQEEAALLFSNFKGSNYIKPEENYLYIDLGGGSTEITVIEKGKKTAAKSFKIGTVRGLNNQNYELLWEELEAWIKEKNLASKKLIGIGTGGNINRLHKEAGMKSYQPLTLEELNNIYDYLSSFSVKDRMMKLKLKPDRADVIVPAAEIYMRIMRCADVSEIRVPKVGLSDGIVLDLYKNWKARTTHSVN